MRAMILDRGIKVRAAEELREEIKRSSEPINSKVITYFMDLEECWAKYGKPGDTMGYTPSVL